MASGPRAKSMGKGTTECSRQSGAMMPSAMERSPEFQGSSRKTRAISLFVWRLLAWGSIALLHQTSPLGDLDDAVRRHAAEPLHGAGGGPAHRQLLGPSRAAQAEVQAQHALRGVAVARRHLAGQPLAAGAHGDRSEERRVGKGGR